MGLIFFCSGCCIKANSYIAAALRVASQLIKSHIVDVESAILKKIYIERCEKSSDSRDKWP